MDRNLAQRWRDVRPPFDGHTLVFGELLHKLVGTAVVRFLLAELDAQFGIDEELFVNQDWHVHDGFVKESETVAKSELLSQLEAQPDKWICVIDYQVHWGIYDASHRFYLRFGLEEDDPSILSVDMTTDETTARQLAENVRSLFGVDCEIVVAKQHFDRIYGG